MYLIYGVHLSYFFVFLIACNDSTGGERIFRLRERYTFTALVCHVERYFSNRGKSSRMDDNPCAIIREMDNGIYGNYFLLNVFWNSITNSKKEIMSDLINKNPLPKSFCR